MSTWVNAFKETKLDIDKGGPAIVWEINQHDIGSDSEEFFMTEPIDLRGGLKKKKLIFALNKNSGSGDPKLYVIWIDVNNNVLATVELVTSPVDILGIKMRLKVKETASATANYSALVRLE